VDWRPDAGCHREFGMGNRVANRRLRWLATATAASLALAWGLHREPQASRLVTGHLSAVWSRHISMPELDRPNDGARRSTLLAADGRLVVGVLGDVRSANSDEWYKRQILFGVEPSTGRQIWHRDMGLTVTGDRLTLSGGSVFALAPFSPLRGHHLKPNIVRLHLSTGAVAWSVPAPPESLTIAASGDLVTVGARDSTGPAFRVNAYDASDGQLRWSAPGNGGRSLVMPLVRRVVLTAGLTTSSGLRSVDYSTGAAQRECSLDSRPPGTAWLLAAGLEDCVLQETERLAVVNVAEMRVRWQRDATWYGWSAKRTPLNLEVPTCHASNGLLYALDAGEETLLALEVRSGAERWRRRLEGKSMVKRCAFGDRLFLRCRTPNVKPPTDGVVLVECFDLRDGRLVGTIEADGLDAVASDGLCIFTIAGTTVAAWRVEEARP
jgi:outer membrane protein assembly factor BamB